MTIEEKNTKETNRTLRGKGVKIQTLSWLFAILGLFLLVSLGYYLHKIVVNYKVLVNEFDKHLISQQYVSDLKNDSDVMTEESRLFVLTKNYQHLEKYYKIVNSNSREKAYHKNEETLKKLGYEESINSLMAVLNASNCLQDYEEHAMKLILETSNIGQNVVPKKLKQYELSEEEKSWSKEKKQTEAYNIMFGIKYSKEKEVINQNIQNAVDAMSENLEQDNETGINNMWSVINHMVIICIMLLIMFAIIIILIVSLIIRPLQVYVKCVKENRAFDLVGAYELKYLAMTYNSIFKVNQENRQQMKFELEHDTLTNAYSRLAFDKEKEMLLHMNIPIALMIIDVDYFKSINDTYGHDVGDAALKKVVEAISCVLRSDDIVARIGGDEFAVLLLNVYEYHKDVIIAKINKINDSLQNSQEEPKLSLSIGVAFSEKGYSEELFKKADTALYDAKKSGRCGYRIYNE